MVINFNNAFLYIQLESEKPVDVQSFLLQIAVGSYPAIKQSNSEARYRDAYSGPETSYMIRDLCPNQQYTLRVCCKTEDGKWSAWSLPHVAVTNIKPYGNVMNFYTILHQIIVNFLNLNNINFL